MKRYSYNPDCEAMRECADGEYVLHSEATEMIVDQIKKKWKLEDSHENLENELVDAKGALRDVLAWITDSQSTAALKAICKRGLNE